jgi:hypothetical protein
MEIDPLFVDVAIRRWQAFTGEKATRLRDGQSFEASELQNELSQVMPAAPPIETTAR